MPSSPVPVDSKRVQLHSPAQPGPVIQMWRPQWESLPPTLIFGVSLLYLWLFRHYSSMDPDEGIVLQGAERILRGEVPYRDFFSFYTPGSFYLVAGLFKIFGDSFVVARSSIAVVGAGTTVLTYLLARRVCPRRIALLAAGLSATSGVAYRFMVLHNWYATFFACLAVYAAVRLLESGTATWAFAAGSFAAFTTLIEQSKGAGLCIGLVVGYIVLRFLGRLEALRIATAVLGFIWPWLILLFYFGSRQALGVMWQNWLWPLQHYTTANHVFYGSQSWPIHFSNSILHTGPWWTIPWKYLAITPGFVVPVVPLIAIAWLAYSSVQLHKGDNSQTSQTRQYYVLLSAILSGLLLGVVLVRPDINHFMYLSPLWYVLLAWIMGAGDVRSQLLQTLRPYLVAYVGIAFGLMGLALLLTMNAASDQIHTRRGTVVTSGNDSVIDYIQAHVAPGDELLVYPYLPLYNYLTKTHSRARVDFFQSGMNTPQQAQEIIDSLKSHPNQAVLFEPGFGGKFASSWPSTPLSAIVNDPVADFIARKYRVCRALVTPLSWRFQFMVPKDKSCH
jgi:4-amino-4-deoxy-L-arabinose transferase-like glycosyltransferase